jgi:hypothetical protein
MSASPRWLHCPPFHRCEVTPFSSPDVSLIGPGAVYDTSSLGQCHSVAVPQCHSVTMPQCHSVRLECSTALGVPKPDQPDQSPAALAQGIQAMQLTVQLDGVFILETFSQKHHVWKQLEKSAG